MLIKIWALAMYVFSSPCIESALKELSTSDKPNYFMPNCLKQEDRALMSEWENTYNHLTNCPDPFSVYALDTAKSEISRIRRTAKRCDKIGDSLKIVNKKAADSTYAAQISLLKRKVSIYKGKFPGDIGLDDDKSSLSEFISVCVDLELDIQTELCTFFIDSTMEISFGAFQSEDFSAKFYLEPTSKLMLPYQVTITSQQLDDCDDAVKAKYDLANAFRYKYGSAKTAIIKTGKKYKSQKCKDYMDEDLTNYSIQDGFWSYTVDSYWLDGSYYVYAAYRFTPRYNEVTRLRSKSKMLKALDGYNKL